tara:strand:+ start:109 stop:831 length:723 start_codon:yes stop_codon:yes gene_type:complete
MIKFFRKIRQKLLTENKFSKYLLYAIGEIILVVIGILIALSINNWNETQKNQNDKKSVYSIIKTDLTTDIENIDKVLGSSVIRESFLKRIIDEDMTKDDYQDCKLCSFILLGFPDIRLNTRGVKLLEDNSAIFNSHQDSLSIEISNFYASSNTIINVALQEVINDYEDNFFYFKNNKAWFKDYINFVKNDDLLSYLLTSDDYMNRANTFYILYFKTYLGHLRDYKKGAQEIIEKINKKIK